MMNVLDVANKVRRFPLSASLLMSMALLSPSCLLVPSSAYSIQLLHLNRGYFPGTAAQQRCHRGRCLLSSDGVGAAENEEAADVEPVYETVVRMDDGGSDLTERFKYKVNALMGVFDPQSGVDDERQSGNIMNALLKFPVRYSFNCVGRTNGDDSVKEQYIEEIKSTVSSLSGDDEEGMEIRITPRGRNFTRITLQVTVESVAIVNSIYDALEKNDKTVMQY